MTRTTTRRTRAARRRVPRRDCAPTIARLADAPIGTLVARADRLLADLSVAVWTLAQRDPMAHARWLRSVRARAFAAIDEALS